MDAPQGSQDFECFCGDRFSDRDQLIQHNVSLHDMAEDESRQKVMEKYPMG
jgi:hypothetical protein